MSPHKPESWASRIPVQARFKTGTLSLFVSLALQRIVVVFSTAP